MSARDRWETTPCRGCGKPIVWAVLVSGGKIPLDPTPPVYKAINSYDEATKRVTYRAERKEQSMVSHFATCPQANKFSASNKETPHAPSQS